MRSAGGRGGIARLPVTTDTNPYQELLYRELGRHGWPLLPYSELSLGWLWRERRTASVLHFHWRPDRLYGWPADFWETDPPRVLLRLRSWLRLGSFGIRLLAARVLGYRLVWTIHEVVPHETISGRMDRIAARGLVRASHLLLAHDQETVSRAREMLGPRVGRVEVVPHGSYVGFYPPGRSRDEVRAELGIPAEAFAFLCFGNLRSWKHIELLLSAFRALELPGACLIVAGRVWSVELADRLRAAVEVDSRIRLLPDTVPVEGVAELFGAADAAALPRGDGWTSGSLVLALSLGLPVVCARRPAYEELLAGAGWLFEAGDPESLRSALESAARDPHEARARGRIALAQAERLSWEDAGRRTADLLAALKTEPPVG